MEIAIKKEENTIKLFIEGITWETVKQVFKEEAVNIYLLVFFVDEDYAFHDENFEQTDNTLSFCKQNILFSELANRLADLKLGNPCEVKIGNKHFHIRQHFSDAFEFTFRKEESAESFLESLRNNISQSVIDNLKSALITGSPFCTDEFNTDFGKANNMERFIEHRFDLWYDTTVREYEAALANGTAHCEGCEDEATKEITS